jgi:hypothetical protein
MNGGIENMGTEEGSYVDEIRNRIVNKDNDMYDAGITATDEEIYFDKIMDYWEGTLKGSMNHTPNYLGLKGYPEDLQEKDFDFGFQEKSDNILEDMKKEFEIDWSIIERVSKIDIASGGRLPLPEKGESVNVRFLTDPKRLGSIYYARCVIYGRESDLQYDCLLPCTLMKWVFSEFEKAKIPIDNMLKCMVGRVFTIAGREWYDCPRELWRPDEVTHKLIAPKTFLAALRLDLEAKAAPSPGPEGTAPDLLFY